jgi:hypothetical protein
MINATTTKNNRTVPYSNSALKDTIEGRMIKRDWGELFYVQGAEKVCEKLMRRDQWCLVL